MLQPQSGSLSQQAYTQLRQQIVTLHLPPGSLIDETSLQNELELGRTPIREALKRLETEQLVTILPRRGMFVTDISILDLQRLFEVRLNLEPLAAELAAKRGKAHHWDQMTHALAQISDDAPANHLSTIHIDERCHHIMYDASDNHYISSHLNNLYTLSLRMWHFALSKKSGQKQPVVKSIHIKDHQLILEALQSGAGELAAHLMAEHIRSYQMDIQRMILEPTVVYPHLVT